MGELDLGKRLREDICNHVRRWDMRHRSDIPGKKIYHAKVRDFDVFDGRREEVHGFCVKGKRQIMDAKRINEFSEELRFLRRHCRCH